MAIVCLCELDYPGAVFCTLLTVVLGICDDFPGKKITRIYGFQIGLGFFPCPIFAPQSAFDRARCPHSPWPDIAVNRNNWKKEKLEGNFFLENKEKFGWGHDYKEGTPHLRPGGNHAESRVFFVHSPRIFCAENTRHSA